MIAAGKMNRTAYAAFHPFLPPLGPILCLLRPEPAEWLPMGFAGPNVEAGSQSGSKGDLSRWCPLWVESGHSAEMSSGLRNGI